MTAQPDPTPLLSLPKLASQCEVAQVLVKAENCRPLGNFKSLGAMSAVLNLFRPAEPAQLVGTSTQMAVPVLICASDGNHGLAVAAAARAVGTQALIYLPVAVDGARAARIEALGASIIRIAGTYDDAVEQARSAAERGGGMLIADTSGNPDDPVVAGVMAGYQTISHEIADVIETGTVSRPTHAFIQAGVGGFAAAMAEGLAGHFANAHCIVVVEPEAAACVGPALLASQPVQIDGDLATCADMLSCGLVSAPAFEILVRHRVQAMTVTEDALRSAPASLLRAGGPRSTASGAAGLAGLIVASANAAQRRRLGITRDSVILLFATEGAMTQHAQGFGAGGVAKSGRRR